MSPPLDGNAVAGALFDVFGAEMTDAESVCARCGATRPVAELAVYLRGPGTVVRCPSCDTVSIVLVEIRGITCVDLRGLERLAPRGL
jgi:LSD1 subclass zinc finger protein